MEQQQILEYIRGQLAAGQTEATVRQHMISSGWSEQAASDVFTQYHISTMAVTQPIAVKPHAQHWLRWAVIAAVVVLAVVLVVVLLTHLPKSSTPTSKKPSPTIAVLQQSADDTARKNDATSIVAAVSEYVSNNAGVLPSKSAVGDSPQTVLLCGATCNATTGSSISLAYYKSADVSFQPYEAGLQVPNLQTAYIVTGVACAAGGKSIGFPDSARSFVVLYGTGTATSVSQHCISS